ncbi:MAG: SprB repeat-containing protein [Bacteroidales bacterium]|nr:SprB repeat-containing protein [Bacteroidales bacterium]
MNPPTCTFPSLPTQWDEYPEDDFSHLRSHTTDFIAAFPPVVDELVQPAPVCVNSNRVLTITASGGTAPYSYQWKVHNGIDPWQNVIDVVGVLCRSKHCNPDNF